MKNLLPKKLTSSFTNSINTKIKPTMRRTGLTVKHYSPEITIGIGIVTGVLALVEIHKAAQKAPEVLKNHEDKMQHLNEVVPTDEEGNELPAEEAHDIIVRDKTRVWARTIVDITKLYLPAALLFAVSMGSFIGSHDIMKKRNAALMAAYETVDKAFEKYRERVVDKLGSEADKDFLFGKRHIEEITTNETDKDGNTVKKKKLAEVLDETPGMYTYLFDELSEKYHKDVRLSKEILCGVERYMNDRLRADGFLFLNTVLHELDIPLTEEGQIIGWVYDPKDISQQDYVDFGIDWDAYVDFGESSTWLTMNCHRPVAGLFMKYDSDRRYKNDKRKWNKAMKS